MSVRRVGEDVRGELSQASKLHRPSRSIHLMHYQLLSQNDGFFAKYPVPSDSWYFKRPKGIGADYYNRVQ
jgi:hypothetical protein